MASKIKEELEGHLDSSKSISLIHSAGLLLKDSIEDVSSENFMRVLQVNIISAAQLNQILLPFMANGSLNNLYWLNIIRKRSC